ncbi:murein biosynthesis integral membrane protein MurJ [Gulosibacter molinativorax]|uniref:Murein biosynthesis integral membrane protein MurJ n=1 Tax=Gulosibacter molinativorax TaxID=256821 RepID=A0ABT7C921_9MICO|nr:lipid II flippase MurJ [Gulosibacter molinativorax]MDJ1371711.1 murein biosynthesis integral membrane protein MurJ [Gulosibacter molinativorax]QUY63132.1 Putative peptidoglycan biosynthesis protein MviN [Gulosibacter molinativorax]
MAKSFGRTSLVLASGTLISRVLGFIKAIVLAQTIGLVGSASADAFANANSLPSNIYSLIAGGLLNAVLVPQIVRATKRGDGGREYVNRLITLAIVVLGTLTIVVTIGAPVLSWIYGVTLSGEQLGLVIAFAYWCLPQIFFYGLYAVVSEILNARSIFAPFAWAPALNNVIAILMLVLFSVIFGADPSGAREISDWTPTMIAMLGGGTTLGVVAQAGVLFLFLRKAGLRYRPDFHFRGTGLGRIGKLAGWSFGLLVVVQITGWLETLAANVAFGQAASLAALQNAWMIFMLPHSIVTVSLTTTMFTSLSEKAADKNIKSVIKDFSTGARAITMFMIFSAFGLMVISPAFARIFDGSDEGLEALALVMCGTLLSLLSYSLLYYVQRVFYAFEDTRSVFLLYALTSPLQLVGIWLVAVFAPVEILVLCLVLVQSAVTWVRFLIMINVLRKRLGSIEAPTLVRAFVRFMVYAIPAAVAGLLVMWGLGGYTAGGWARASIFNALVTCLIAGVVMAIVYFGIAMAARSSELEPFVGPIIRRIVGRRGRHSVELARHSAAAVNADRFADEHDSLVHQYTPDVSSAFGSSSQSHPDSEMAMASQVTQEMPSRRDLRDYERKKQREAYEKRHAIDDEPLI